MRTLLIGFLSISFFVPLQGQGLTESFVDSLWNNIPHKGKALQNTEHLNFWLQTALEPDTVFYQRSGDTIVYTFRGKEINADASHIGEERPILYWHTGIHGFQLRGCLYTSSSGDGIGLREKSMLVRTHSCDAITSNEVITIENYRNDVLDGRCVTIDRRLGNILIEGSYTQIDSIWQVTILYVEPINYDTLDSIVVRNKFPIKEGRWLYYNKQGDTIKIEEYPEID